MARKYRKETRPCYNFGIITYCNAESENDSSWLNDTSKILLLLIIIYFPDLLVLALWHQLRPQEPGLEVRPQSHIPLNNVMI